MRAVERGTGMCLAWVPFKMGDREVLSNRALGGDPE